MPLESVSKAWTVSQGQYEVTTENSTVIANHYKEYTVTVFSHIYFFITIYPGPHSIFWFECFQFANCLFGVYTINFTNYYISDLLVLLLLFLNFWHRKAEQKEQRFPIYSMPWQIHSLPHYQHPPPEWYICYNWWTYTDTSLLPRVISLH